MNKEIMADEVWHTILGDWHGLAFRSALQLIALIPAEEFRKAIQAIDRETAIGPLLNPTAYLGGRRFKNAQEYIDILEQGYQLSSRLQALLEKKDGITDTI